MWPSETSSLDQSLADYRFVGFLYFSGFVSLFTTTLKSIAFSLAQEDQGLTGFIVSNDDDSM